MTSGFFLILSLILYISSALLLPVLFWQHRVNLKEIKGGESRTTQIVFHTLYSKFMLGMIIVVSLNIVIIVFFFKVQHPSPPDFEFFQLSEYNKELKYLHQMNSNINKTQLDEIARIFSHSLKLISMPNYPEAEHILSCLKSGEDENGKFLKFKSYAVDNNLAVLSFYLRRNKNFRASALLQSALNYKHLNPTAEHIINNNLELLDKSVNFLD